jgi:hypothetical protein
LQLKEVKLVLLIVAVAGEPSEMNRKKEPSKA